MLIKASGALTDKEKAETEYWGIFGMAPAPELIEMTKFVSDTNDLRLDDDVKLFFVASNAIFDASIASWDAKYGYDYVRPITVIRALGDTLISAWRPRSLEVLAYSTPAAKEEAEYSPAVPAGLGEMRAADWEPYLPTPPFPSYISGHSAFTASWARAMELATEKPDFNFSMTVKHLYVEQRELAKPVTLLYPTFASAADAAGMSRIWAGVHWPADNERGLELGRKVGENALASRPAVPCLERRRRPRPRSRLFGRPIGSTTMKHRIIPPILTRLRGSRSTCPLMERAGGGALWSMRRRQAPTGSNSRLRP